MYFSSFAAMIAPMKWIGDDLRGLNSLRRVQWMLSMLAIVVCLWSVATLHSHDAGLHALDSACISCDLEDITSHGATVTVAVAAAPGLSYIEQVIPPVTAYLAAARIAAPIRAPPVFS